jgi:hypothetical protein
MKNVYEKMGVKMLAEYQNVRRNVDSSDLLQELKNEETSSSVSLRSLNVLVGCDPETILHSRQWEHPNVTRRL